MYKKQFEYRGSFFEVTVYNRNGYGWTWQMGRKLDGVNFTNLHSDEMPKGAVMAATMFYCGVTEVIKS